MIQIYGYDASVCMTATFVILSFGANIRAILSVLFELLSSDYGLGHSFTGNFAISWSRAGDEGYSLMDTHGFVAVARGG